jgi:hypothetical protein
VRVQWQVKKQVLAAGGGWGVRGGGGVCIWVLWQVKNPVLAAGGGWGGSEGEVGACVRVQWQVKNRFWPQVAGEGGVCVGGALYTRLTGRC